MPPSRRLTDVFVIITLVLQSLSPFAVPPPAIAASGYRAQTEAQSASTAESLPLVLPAAARRPKSSVLTPEATPPAEAPDAAGSLKAQPLVQSQTVAAPNAALFIENVGQFDPQARFLVRGAAGNLFLSEDALWYTFVERPVTPVTPTMAIEPFRPEEQPRRGVSLKVSFVGANPHPRLEPFDRLDTHVSYFIGNDPAQWHTDVPVWAGVRYVDLYPGIDLELTGQNGHMVQRLVVRDAAQLNRVRLRVDGARAVGIETPNGAAGHGNRLRVATALGDVNIPLLQVAGLTNVPQTVPDTSGNEVLAPFADTTVDNNAASLSGQFLQDLNSGFPSPTSPLFYSTYLGSDCNDYGLSVAADESGAAYLTGFTWSCNFPTTVGAIGIVSRTNVFVAKIDPYQTGSASLIYSVLIGGSGGGDEGRDISVAGNGAAYVTGVTDSADFPSSLIKGQRQHDDVFVLRLNSAGNALSYSTILGGENDESYPSIALDANEKVYVTGSTGSSDFFTTPGVIQATCGSPCSSGFVAKLNATGDVVYATYFGSQNGGAERINDVDVDAQGNAYLAGGTEATDFPAPIVNGYSTTLQGRRSAFVAKLNQSGAALLYSTYLGGTLPYGSGPKYDDAYAIAVDKNGAAYITGDTNSIDFPTRNAFQPHIGSDGENAFVAKIDTFQSGDASLVYSTYLGGSGLGGANGPEEFGTDIAVDANGGAYVTGYADSSDFPTTAGAVQSAPLRNPSGIPCCSTFVAKFDGTGRGLEYSTLLGGGYNGTTEKYEYKIALDPKGIVYVAGTTSGNWPTTDQAYQRYMTSPYTNDDVTLAVLVLPSVSDGIARNPECPLCNSADARNHVAGPIDTFSGNYTYQKTDESIPVPGGALAFERSYSADTRDLFTRTLGYGWTHNQDIHLAFPTDPDGAPGQIVLKAPGGSQLPFFDQGNGTYQPYPGITAQMSRLTATGGITTYVVTATNQTIYTFNAAGRVTQTVNPAGNALSYTYYLTGPLQAVQSYGRSLRFFYDGQNRLAKVLDPINRATQFLYDANGDLVNVVDTRSLTWTYQYSGTTHLLSRILDPDQKTVERTVFDGQGRAIQQYTGQDELIVKLEFGSGGVITVTDGLTRTAVDRYGRGTWLGGADSASQAITRTYDANFKPTYVADPNGNGPRIQWSANGSNLERVVDAGGYTTTMQYDGLNNPTLITDTRGFTTAYGYSGSLLTRTIDALGHTTVYTYGPNNLLIAQQDPLGRVTGYEYNPFGQRTVMTDALNNVTRFDYDAVGRLITATAPLNLPADAGGGGRITVNAYDNADQLIAVTNNYTSTSAQQNYLNTYNLITRYGYDGFGRQVAVTDTLNHVTRNEYDPAGRLIKTVANYTDTPGVSLATYNLTTTFGYDAVGNQIAVTDTLQHVTFTEYDNLNRPVTVTQNYKGNGLFDPGKPDENVKRITHYDPAGNVIEQIDPPNANGESRVTRNWYDSLNRVISTTANFTTVPGADPNTYNLTTWYEYDSAGNQVAITDTQQHVTRNYFDPIGRLISTTVNFTTAGGPNYLNQYNLTTRYEYDAVGNRVAVTDTMGTPTRYIYDQLNRVIATANVSGTTYTQYDAIGNRVMVTDALTHTTVYTYNAVGQLSRTQDASGNVTAYGYDALGRTIVVTDPLAHAAHTYYDEAGRVVSTTNALTGTTVITYNALGQRSRMQDARGSWTDYQYDGVGRTTVMTDATGSVMQYQYDAPGNRIQAIDGLDHTMTSTYDAANRLVMTQDALGNTTRYGYDSLGNRVVLTDANGVATGYGYDAVSRLSTVTESMTGTMGLDPNQYNLITRYAYDPVGNRIAMTDALTHTTVYTYDRLSRLSMLQDARGSLTRYLYDAVGNRTKVIDANNQPITYTYDALNRNTKIDYGTSLVKFEYDPVGNRKVMTDALGVTRYLYDALNRPISITDPFTGTVQYRYDAAGNRTQMIYPDGKIVTSTFDAANRLTGTLSWDGKLTTYAFDKVGRLITTTWPNGVQSINTYDNAGRLVNLTHQGPYWLLATYTYALDATGNRLAVQERVLPPTPFVYLPLIMKDDGGEQMMAPGQSAPFDSPLAVPEPFQSPLPPVSSVPPYGAATPLYDPSLLIVAPVALAAVVARKKGRKGALFVAVLAGALVIVGQTHPGGAMPAPMPFLSPQSPPPGCTLPSAIGDTHVISYTYDPLYHLTNAAYSSGECYQYDYDRVGNRTAMTTTVGTTTYQYDNANRLSSASGVSYTWDNNGNLLNDGNSLYRYDPANRLISTTLGGTTSLFNYNGDGVRLKQVVAGTVTTYTQDLAAPLPVVLQSRSGMTTTRYLYNVGTQPLAQSAAAWEYLLPDALGSVRQIANASGHINLARDYEPYGNVLNGSGSGESVYGFTGEERDQSGLIFLRARYMQPKLGIFLARDPWPGYEQTPGTYNGFNYAMGNPINLNDPTGFDASPGIVYFSWCLDLHTVEPVLNSYGIGPSIPLGAFTTAQQAVDICRAAYSSASWATVPIRGFDFTSDLPRTAHDLFGWFLYDHRGNHTDRLYFDANQPLTQELAKTGEFDQIRAWYYTGQLGIAGIREYQFGVLQQLQSFTDLYQSMGNASVSISMLMGSFWYQVVPLEGGNRIGFRIDNDTTLSSGSHVPGRYESGGYFVKSVEDLIHDNPSLVNKPIAEIIRNPDTYPVISILENRTRKETGGQGGGNLYQTYRWSEEYDCDWAFHIWVGSWPHDLQVWDGTGTVEPPGWPAQ